jgi:hypothetical protein
MSHKEKARAGYDAIVIPTYHRGNTIGTDTLNTLVGLGTDMTRVHVFIGGDQDGYAGAKDFHNTVNWHTAPTGLGPAMNHIRDTFPEGANIVSMDDDVLRIHQLTPDGKRLQPITPAGWDEMLNRSFDFLRAQRITIWSTALTSNPFYMANKWAAGFYKISGQLYGYINDRSIRITEPAKQDLELSAHHFLRDGALGRLNNITIDTQPMRKQPGGLQHDGARDTLEKQATASMLDRFPAIMVYKPVGTHPQDDLDMKRNGTKR